MKKDPLIFIGHIMEAIIDIESSTKNLSKAKFEANKDIRDATVRRIEIIGEATKNLSESFREKYPKIEWKKMAGVRDKIIHQYFGVDWDTIFDIAKKDLLF